MPLRTGCSACYPATGGTRTRFELTAGTRWSSIWAPPTGCWWWTRPASSRRGARRGASRWGCRDSTAAPRGGSKIPQWEYSWPTLAPGAGPGWTGSCSCLRYGWRTGSDAVPPGCRSMSNSAPRREPQLAQWMLERAVGSGIPRGWVTGDAVYGSDRNRRRWLEGQEGIPQVLAIKSNEQLWAGTEKGPRPVRADRLPHRHATGRRAPANPQHPVVSAHRPSAAASWVDEAGGQRLVHARGTAPRVPAIL